MAGTIGGVPASNLAGSSAGSKPSSRHAADHAAAAQERRHRLQQFAAAVEHADAGGPEHLVPAEGQKVGVQRLHVGRLMRHALRRVDQHQRPGARARGDDLVERIDRAQHVRDRRHGHDARARGRAARRARRVAAARRR